MDEQWADEEDAQSEADGVEVTALYGDDDSITLVSNDSDQSEGDNNA